MKPGVIIRRARKLFAMRPFAWLTMLATMLVLTLIAVPGEFVYPWPDESGEMNAWRIQSNALREAIRQEHAKEISDPSGARLVIIEHGWPKPCLARALVFNQMHKGKLRKKSTASIRIKSWFTYWGGSKFISVSWSDYDNWPLTADGWTLNYGAACLNIVTFIGIALIVGLTMNWWLKSRDGKLWAFGLRDLLILVTLLGGFLGVYGYHTRIRMQEGLAGKWRPPGFRILDGQMSVGQEFCGPVWVRKLAGHKYLAQLFHHVTSASIRTNKQWEESYAELLKFPYLDTLRPRYHIPLGAFEDLQACKQLVTLHLSFSSKTRPPDDELQIPVMTVDELHRLGQLRLENLHLHGDQIEAQHLEQVAALPTLKRISVMGISANEEAIERVRQKFPEVEIEVKIDWSAMYSG